MIRVVVADDQALVRRGFASILDATDGITVVGEADHGAEAVAIAVRERPDVVLMDVRMPHMDGLEATRRITSDPALGGVRILILTTFDLDEYVHEALCAGASGFLLKDTMPEELIHAVRVIAEGEALISPRITRRLIEEFSRLNGPRAVDEETIKQLTDREREVLELIARGLSNTEIAAELYVSQATVKTHIGRLLMKLDARDRAQLVVAAYEAGVVQPGS
ncbi:MAG: response regulator transcription factor [Ilumatobacteraceae bacterium]|nr:response regulator transcription factor [Ilumatobacter sp.]MCO5332101.1 response regulator transcription factor [Ilumatobacteraceae bacterium]